MADRGSADELLASAAAGLEKSGEKNAEVYVRRARRGLARFANNAIGQHGEIVDVEVAARVYRDGKLALASTTDTHAEAIARVVRDAAALCEHVPALEGFPGFAPFEKAELSSPPLSTSTAGATAASRAELLGPQLARAAHESLVLSGTLETIVTQAAAATTAGQRIAGETAYSVARLFAVSPSGASGFGGAMHRDLSAIDLGALASRAIERCKQAENPAALGPGEYDVLLEPPAVAELMEWLNLIGWSARDVEQGTSFLAGRAGETITGDKITFQDDPARAIGAGFSLPFDREGVPRKRVVMVERGVARAPVYDRFHAARAGVVSDGHAMFLEGEVVPCCQAVELLPGTGDEASMLARLDKGLLVSRFHYVNGLLETRRAVMTGMTRDGTYWVEHGKPTHAVKNLRFTDSILEALTRVDAISRQSEAIPTWWTDGGGMFAPSLLIRGLKFTGGAEPT